MQACCGAMATETISVIGRTKQQQSNAISKCLDVQLRRETSDESTSVLSFSSEVNTHALRPAARELYPRSPNPRRGAAVHGIPHNMRDEHDRRRCAQLRLNHTLDSQTPHAVSVKNGFKSKLTIDSFLNGDYIRQHVRVCASAVHRTATSDLTSLGKCF